jgi:hypothetical protein
LRPELLSLRLFLAALLALAAGHVSVAQQWHLVQSQPIHQPQVISLDRLGQVYVADNQSNLFKFSPQGKLLFTYSPAQRGRLAVVEAWNPVKILLFYEDRQQILLLDRFLTPITTIRLNDLSTGLIRLATLGSDDQFWIFNESDFTLSKVDPRYPDSRLQTNLNQILNNAPYDFRLLREYQNNVYLVDRNTGIYIFDNMGNYRKHLPVKGMSSLGFKGDEGYYLQDNQLVFFNLYTHQQRTLPLPAGKSYQQVLIGDKTAYLFTGTHLDIYLFEN